MGGVKWCGQAGWWWWLKEKQEAEHHALILINIATPPATCTDMHFTKSILTCCRIQLKIEQDPHTGSRPEQMPGRVRLTGWIVKFTKSAYLGVSGYFAKVLLHYKPAHQLSPGAPIWVWERCGRGTSQTIGLSAFVTLGSIRCCPHIMSANFGVFRLAYTPSPLGPLVSNRQHLPFPIICGQPII